MKCWFKSSKCQESVLLLGFMTCSQNEKRNTCNTYRSTFKTFAGFWKIFFLSFPDTYKFTFGFVWVHIFALVFDFKLDIISSKSDISVRRRNVGLRLSSIGFVCFYNTIPSEIECMYIMTCIGDYICETGLLLSNSPKHKPRCRRCLFIYTELWDL